jgi:carbonic anhydrase
MSIADRACAAIEAKTAKTPAPDQSRAVEQAVVRVSLDNLLSFPWIRERVTGGALSLHGWYFDIESGELSAFEAQSDEFRPL